MEGRINKGKKYIVDDEERENQVIDQSQLCRET
jgi:hypothetical protein